MVTAAVYRGFDQELSRHHLTFGTGPAYACEPRPFGLHRDERPELGLRRSDNNTNANAQSRM